jgi:hypothetical protein
MKEYSVFSGSRIPYGSYSPAIESKYRYEKMLMAIQELKIKNYWYLR